MAENTKPKSKMDLAFEEFEQDISQHKEMRKAMIEKLFKTAQKMEISEYDKAMTIQAKLMISKTADDLMKSSESMTLQKFKMHLARKEQENNGQYSQAVIELLKMVRADDRGGSSDKPHQTDDEVQAQIQARGKELNIEVSEGETQACGGAPGESSEDPREKKDPEPKDEEKPKDEDKGGFKF